LQRGQQTKKKEATVDAETGGILEPAFMTRGSPSYLTLLVGGFIMFVKKCLLVLETHGVVAQPQHPGGGENGEGKSVRKTRE